MRTDGAQGTRSRDNNGHPTRQERHQCPASRKTPEHTSPWFPTPDLRGMIPPRDDVRLCQVVTCRGSAARSGNVWVTYIRLLAPTQSQRTLLKQPREANA